MTVSIIDQLLDTYPLITDMIHKHQLKLVLECLERTILNDVDGDVVELGCNEGTTSMFIRRLLDHYRSDKQFYVYDSFQGLPDVSVHDISKTERQFTAGGCKTERDKLVANFTETNLAVPVITEGWFIEIDDNKYPDTISFAFFDGDFYSSILDSFLKVYHKLSPNAVVCIHDFGWHVLPGVEQACEDFLKDKPEQVYTKPNSSIGVLTKMSTVATHPF